MPQLSRRRAIALVVLALVAGGVSYSRAPRPDVGRAAQAQLADGAWLADSLAAAERVADPSASRSTARELRRNQRAIALGYLERHRLGLGSPFRLADQARQDPRLPPALRQRLAWGLLSRTLQQGGYAMDPAVLAPLHRRASWQLPAEHLAFIERAIAGAGDPRAGELALRIAYALAASERVLPSGAPALTAPVLAFVRDRIEAANDARRLLWAAQKERRDALQLMAEWRASLRLEVERPASEARDRALEPAVARLAGALLDSLRVMMRDRGVATPDSIVAPALVASGGSEAVILSRDAAARLSALARQQPPQAPVVVTVRSQRAALPSGARERFLDRALNEEGLAAEYARLRHGDVDAGAAARIVVSSAVALRPHAQAPIWFPGGPPGPAAADVARALGLRAIVFDEDVPGEWRPYYLASLQRSVSDLQRVLPQLSLAGARVHFVRESPQRGALALHDPGTRTVVLPITTAGGTIAHELAHELDWQAARRLYARRGTYSTDRAVAEERGRLAASVRGLTAARLVAPDASNGYRAPHDKRPAEVFARNLDWFVAVSLAREGRANGDLSAVQDEVLTGYASVLPGEVGGPGAHALLDILGEVAYVNEPVREWLLQSWGPSRDESGLPLVRRLLESPLPHARALEERGASAEVADPALVLGHALASCAAPRRSDRDVAAWRLASLAADSRARGVLKVRVRALRERGDVAAADALEGAAPWSAADGEALVARLREALLRDLRMSRVSRSVFAAGDGGCGER